MSNMSDEHMDQHFKAAAEGAQFPFDESAWSSLEKKLRGSGLGYYQTIGAVLLALILIVGTAIYLLNPLTGQSFTASNSVIANQDISDDVQEKPIGFSDKKGISTAQNTNTIGHLAISEEKETEPISNINGDSKSNLLSNNDEEQKQDNEMVFTQQAKGERLSEFFLTKHQRLGSDLTVPYIPIFDIQGIEDNLAKTPIVKEKPKSLFALKLQYAPDISSVGYFNGGKIGSNWGLAFEYTFRNRWSLSTGVILSKKLYYTENQLSSYSYGASNIEWLEADCKVLDIPINLNYKIINRALSGGYVSAGVSSYIMLSEDYEYKTDQGGWTQSYSNKNNHLFSIVNLSFGYEHRLSSKMSLQVEPFMKLPIAKIGEGKVDLVSSGAFINLKYQLK